MRAFVIGRRLPINTQVSLVGQPVGMRNLSRGNTPRGRIFSDQRRTAGRSMKGGVVVADQAMRASLVTRPVEWSIVVIFGLAKDTLFKGLPTLWRVDVQIE